MSIVKLNTIKTIYLICIILVISCVPIAINNRKFEDNKINISSSNTILRPIAEYNIIKKELKNDDIVVKVKVLNNIEKSNGSIKIPARILDVIQGSIEKEDINIYDKNNVYVEGEKNYISVYGNNILLPGEIYYLILSEIEYKTWYMPSNSYKLKDDLSIFSNNKNYIFLKKDDNNEYNLSQVKDILYFFSDKDSIESYNKRNSDINKLISLKETIMKGINNK